ncbi:MAG: PilZ domain-containing protein [Pseudomonadota bacterium]
MSKNNRKHTRSICNLEINIKDNYSENKISGVSFDISDNGLFLELNSNLQSHEQFKGNIILPNNVKLDFSGQPVYFNNNEVNEKNIKNIGYGISIENLNLKSHKVFKEFLSSINQQNSIETVNILEANTSSLLKKFINFPFQLYNPQSNWIAPLKKDLIKLLSKDSSFSKHSELKLFLAVHNNKLVGRIAAIIDHNYNTFNNSNIGFWGFYECIGNINVSNKLFQNVVSFSKTRGLSKIVGPLNPSFNHDLGFLSSGYPNLPNMQMPYNFIYYNNFAINFGFKKLKDIYSYNIDITDKLSSKIDKLDIVKDDDIKIRSINKKNFWSDAKILRYLFNESYSAANHWGFAPVTEDEWLDLAKHLKEIMDYDLVLIAEYKSKPIGYLICVPNISEILHSIRGSISLIDIIKFPFQMKKVNNIRALSIGVLKPYWKKFVGLKLLKEGVTRIKEKGYSTMEYGWVLDDNYPSIYLAKQLKGKLSNSYSVYELDI